MSWHRLEQNGIAGVSSDRKRRPHVGQLILTGGSMQGSSVDSVGQVTSFSRRTR
ncbi:hypothetical protein RBSH_05854 [Rhodopirellula baltica SH28]|uniref:Uncharacterized protein n=1 Tax=Rhodopirellula baltica SH28 TaxID=993517 RepID=K5CXJ0_RHOBT|nr:hypothetical protein RBSH_05854 [Rhodopirellula baltica SH28]